MAARDRLLPLNNSVERDEAALIRGVCAGRKELFHELIGPYERGIYLTPFSILRNPADAEEVAQETLVKAFSHLDQLRSDEKFNGWLLLIAVNEVRMRRRKDHQQLFESIEDEAIETEEGDFMPHQFADWRDIPSEVLDKKEIRSAVQKALDGLPQKYRSVSCVMSSIAAWRKPRKLSVSPRHQSKPSCIGRDCKYENNWRLSSESAGATGCPS